MIGSGFAVNCSRRREEGLKMVFCKIEYDCPNCPNRYVCEDAAAARQKIGQVMKFVDEEHKAFFEQQVANTRTQDDVCREAMFYALGLTDTTAAI